MLAKRRWTRYVLALMAGVAGIVLAWLAELILGGIFFALPLALVALVALVAGLAPGLLAAATIGVGLGLMIAHPVSLEIRHGADVWRLLAFLASAYVISAVSGSQRRARDRLAVERGLAREAARQAEQSAATSRRAAEALRLSEQRYRAAAEALGDADKRKDDFLAVLSHELRNPLAPLTMALEVLERAAPGSDEAGRAVTVSRRQTAQLARLIDDLLDITRIAHGKIALKRAPVELGALARRVVDDLSHLFASRGVSLEVHVEPEPIFVDGDEARLAQILGNLLQNAAKFTDAGGYTRVFVERAEDGRGCLRVIDTGAGIAPEMMSRLFEPFAQADRTLDRIRGGLGLGLSLVKGLTELHGGEVRATSAGADAGAELTVVLPTSSERPVAPEASHSTAARSQRVLLIEDNVDAAEMLSISLAQCGHEVEVAHDGPEGLARARAIRPDLVVCDIGLPGMSGYAVAEAFRADEELSTTRLVALTGYASPDDRLRAQRAGFDTHLAKPVQLDAIRRVVDSLG